MTGVPALSPADVPGCWPAPVCVGGGRSAVVIGATASVVVPPVAERCVVERPAALPDRGLGGGDDSPVGRADVEAVPAPATGLPVPAGAAGPPGAPAAAAPAGGGGPPGHPPKGKTR